MKTNELTGAALDWAVAKCEGVPIGIAGGTLWHGHTNKTVRVHYSTNWAQGGPIIEQEGIEFRASGTQASIVDGRTYYGPTHLIAAMRCYVASKLGDEVEVPVELLGD